MSPALSPAAFHFLRPEWLWLALPAALVLFLLQRREDPVRPFRDVVNDALRRGLLSDPRRRAPFRVKTRSLGGLRPGLQIDNIGELLEGAEGSRHK